MKKRLSTLLLSTILLFGLTTPLSAFAEGTSEDIGVSGIFTDEHHAYMVGYPDKTVRPEQAISRAEVSTVFFRMLQDDVRSANWAQSSPYPDVSDQEWYANAISVMNKMGIVGGYPDGSFNPDGSITRAEMATIAAKFVESQGASVASSRSFTDIDGHWAADYIRTAASVGWIAGYEDGSFRPEQNITRAEFVTLANRILERAPELEGDLLSDMAIWSDNMDRSQWYYLDVQEATNSHDYERKDGLVPGRPFHYETWTKLLPIPDWSQLEEEWADENSNNGDILSSLNNTTFTFASGAGAWSTEVVMKKNGNFEGYYHDSNMGSVGPDYPNGIQYECFFSGKFTINEKIDDYTYSLKLVNLNQQGIEGEEKIIDGIKVITATPYGLENTDTFLLYLPGRSTNDLPEEFLRWVQLSGDPSSKLPSYGLYNTGEQQGFASWR